MRYQKAIIDRLQLGLLAVDRDVAEAFVEHCKPPASSLEVFADKVNHFFLDKAKEKGFTPAGGALSCVPEDKEAISYWIEDIERVIHPILRFGASS